MRHRLYYLLPDVAAARAAMDELLLARIEARHIRFMTAGPSLPPDLPEASLLQRTDVVRGAEMGMAAGAALGLLAGIGLLYYFDLDRAGVKAAVVVIAALLGMLFGAWASSMQGASLPNSRLAAFAPELEAGNILLIADVPAGSIEKVETIMAERHPEMRFKGEESHIPTFP
ncbi:DUF1269 domain-containing protein [Noviherbaspirillum suwonense]|uniref:DUF1269 domain-containing protein n=1 Tax=Noviherbaspirillum suwonense TaxID=1224511 RepID=A0ABY1Q9F7_9BURK|nr:DUF1269 domain-containing protein [Noviherbaspirillum suwonense]SMP62436.1 hypothetical protein SAMN06295970_108115 [Noviherbaspirillum suwonense]